MASAGREAATREVLDLISRSRDDAGPAFEAILAAAARLCETPFAGLYLADAARTEAVLAASLGARPDYLDRALTRWPMDSPAAVPQAIVAGRTVQIADLADTDAYWAGDRRRVEAVEIEGIRTFLAVPLMQGGRAIGAIGLYRREVRPFDDGQIALVETFAAQAVIAIENARQFHELQERLAREAATREVLEVISTSRDDDRPVFDAILRRMAELCGAYAAALVMGGAGDAHVRMAAHHGVSPATVAVFDRGEVPMDAGSSFTARAILSGRTVHVEDMQDTDNYRSGVPHTLSVVQDSGIRTIMLVPLVASGQGIGAFMVFRREVRPFSPEEVTLAETFAAQALIAIENARQFRELQERLAQQAASAEILGVISASRDDDAPVFDVIVRNGQVLCAAPQAALILAESGNAVQRLVAHRNLSDPTVEMFRSGRMKLDGTLSYAAKSILEAEVINLADMRESDLYRAGSPVVRAMVDDVGIRSVLFLPLMSGDRAIGTFALFRYEVTPFDDRHVALVRTFAAQAVIAIENVRQFRELQTRLEREAATRDILEVISQSRDDDTPVFEVIAQNAARLCHAANCTFWRVENGLVHYCASHGFDRADFEDDLRTPISDATPLLDNTLIGQAVKTRSVARIEDGTAESYFNHAWVRAHGLRHLIGVPIFVGGEVWGSINLMWPPDRAPRDEDIQLVESFAAQAAIAIENVRQFRELQDRLEREAATRNILRVISESPDDEQPTFEAILDSATRLCGTPFASLVLGRRGDASQKMVAHRGTLAETLALFRDGKVPMDPEDSLGARAILEGRTIHVPDMADTDQYRAGHPRFRLVVDNQGLRTNLFVPLLGPEGGIGCFILWKKEAAPFTADQIALVETFASHAVIAIENVRQFRALEALNAELGDRVQDQVGEIERMGRLKRFLPAAVADAVVTSGSERMLSSHRALLGVLFCDMRGFTAFCETAEPEETIEVLQTYHEEMGRLIEAHGAGVDHRMGDGIMVLFNDPLPCDDPAGAAVRLALAMRGRMAELCARWKKMGHRLGFGVGIALGYATVGMVGSGGRQDYTASGTAINLASRLCDEAGDGEILVSPRVRAAVEDDFSVESRGEIAFKGIREPLEVFRLVGAAG